MKPNRQREKNISHGGHLYYFKRESSTQINYRRSNYKLKSCPANVILRGSDILSRGNHICIDIDSQAEPGEAHARTTRALVKTTAQVGPASMGTQ